MKSKILDTQPPASVENERAVLGSLINDPTKCNDIFPILHQGDFYDEANKILFAHLREMHDRSLGIDVTTLNHRLREAGVYEKIGGAVYLGEIVRSAPVATHALHYAGIVREVSAKRRLRFLGERLLQESANGKAPEQSISDALLTLENIKGAAVDDSTKFDCISSAEFDCGEYTTSYHIDGFLPEVQPAVLAAQLKTMKSTAGVAIGFSIATGQPLFNYFAAPNPCRVLLMNAESGAGAMQETGRRIAESYGMQLSDATGLVWCQNVPRLDSEKDIRGIEKAIRENEASMVIFDPLYFMLPGDDAGNLMKQGALLREMSAMLQSIGCSSMFIHHAKKLVANPGGPLELTDISWSGTAEWARSWILLSRREPYQGGSGIHRLWCSYGGSAGHSGLIGLDIDEGISPNRHWRVEVLQPDEIRDGVEERKSQAKDEKQRTAVDAAKSRLVRAALKFKDGETEKTIKDAAGVSGTQARMAFAELISNGDLLPVGITKGNRKSPYQGYKLKDDTTH